MIPQPSQPGQSLHGLAQPHVIGQQRPASGLGQSGKKAKTFKLIRPQLCAQRAGQIGRNRGGEHLGSLIEAGPSLIWQQLMQRIGHQLQGVEKPFFASQSGRPQPGSRQALQHGRICFVHQSPKSFFPEVDPCPFCIEQ